MFVRFEDMDEVAWRDPRYPPKGGILTLNIECPRRLFGFAVEGCERRGELWGLALQGAL